MISGHCARRENHRARPRLVSRTIHKISHPARVSTSVRLSPSIASRSPPPPSRSASLARAFVSRVILHTHRHRRVHRTNLRVLIRVRHHSSRALRHSLRSTPRAFVSPCTLFLITSSHARRHRVRFVDRRTANARASSVAGLALFALRLAHRLAIVAAARIVVDKGSRVMRSSHGTWGPFVPGTPRDGTTAGTRKEARARVERRAEEAMVVLRCVREGC